MIGDIVKKYESGNLGPEAISNDAGDPGGASYGTYQLSANTGTLMDFLTKAGYARYFTSLTPGTENFNQMWLGLCNRQDFVDAQYQYIYATHYRPVRAFATSIGIMDTAAIDEAVWSMSVQHGRADKIIQNAVDDDIDDLKNETDTIVGLYNARCDYVDSLGMGYLKERYKAEVKDVLAMVQT